MSFRKAIAALIAAFFLVLGAGTAVAQQDTPPTERFTVAPSAGINYIPGQFGMGGKIAATFPTGEFIGGTVKVGAFGAVNYVSYFNWISVPVGGEIYWDISHFLEELSPLPDEWRVSIGTDLGYSIGINHNFGGFYSAGLVKLNVSNFFIEAGYPTINAGIEF